MVGKGGGCSAGSRQPHHSRPSRADTHELFQLILDAPCPVGIALTSALQLHPPEAEA